MRVRPPRREKTPPLMIGFIVLFVFGVLIWFFGWLFLNFVGIHT